MERLRITIDTREQTPWEFSPEFAVCEIGTLRTGDYALSGDDGFAIERKSLDDFLGTIATGWERFSRELDRMDAAAFPVKVIIIESDFVNTCFCEVGSQIVAPRHNHPNLTPQFIAKRIAQLTMRGCSVIFAATPDLAAGLAYNILKERYEQWQSSR